MAPIIISISGVRGIIGQSLGPREGVEFGLAFGSFLRQKKSSSGDRPRVCIGRDSRPSGPMLADAFGSGLLAAGCDVIDLGLVTTPGVAIMTRFLAAGGGVVITASHNPIEWNGIKLLSREAVAFPADLAAEIQRFYYDKKFIFADACSVGVSSAENRTHDIHVDSVLRICDKAAIASRRFKVVLDSINGAGCVVTAHLLSALGCELIHLNNQPTGRFAHTPEPTAENLADLGPQVLKHKAALGFAQDPDADRLAVIDEQGRYIGEEYTLALAAKYIFSRKKGTAAANLSTSRMIDALAAAAGSAVVRTPVGETHVAHAMQQNHCIIGGEGNGGVIDLRVVPVRDSLVAIALILQLLAETGQTVSQLVSEIPHYHIVKTKFPCPADKAPEILSAVQRYYRQSSRENVKIDTRDGVRIDLPSAWVQLRASNTEPIMRIIAEADSPDLAQRLIDEITQQVNI